MGSLGVSVPNKMAVCVVLMRASFKFRYLIIPMESLFMDPPKYSVYCVVGPLYGTAFARTLFAGVLIVDPQP